jgi:hypothetical protein
VERVAEFAVTQVAFNHKATYLACSSVANSISLVTLKEGLGRPGIMPQFRTENMYAILTVIVALMVIGLWKYI